MSWLEIPFKTPFKHASAERAKTASFLIKATSTSGITGYGEGCPRAYVTGEDFNSARTFFNKNSNNLQEEVRDLSSLKNWMSEHAEEIDQHPAAWCAIELALLDLLGRELQASQEALLGISELEGEFRYSAVLGDSPMPAFEKQVSQYIQFGFDDFKLKLSGNIDQDLKKIEYLKTWPIRIRADANNFWGNADAAHSYLRELDMPFWAIEEPITAKDFQGLATLASRTSTRIILDESFTHKRDLSTLTSNPDIWLLNFRVSKLGGLIRSLELLEKARSHRLKVIIGAHVGETSLLTRAGLTLAMAAAESRIAMEGAFGTYLLAKDICEPSLIFESQGILSRYPKAEPGNGLAVI